MIKGIDCLKIKLLCKHTDFNCKIKMEEAERSKRHREGTKWQRHSEGRSGRGTKAQSDFR
jgi:hypothetical protein